MAGRDSRVSLVPHGHGMKYLRSPFRTIYPQVFRSPTPIYVYFVGSNAPTFYEPVQLNSG